MIGERKLSISYVTAYRILTVAKQAERCTSHLGVIFKIDMWVSALVLCSDVRHTQQRGKNSIAVTLLRSMTHSCQFEISNFASVTQILCFDERDMV